mmetsp:Transcript_41185/g.87907  ORF Transcript_41185/g.87907 Transcript_41185/m.87907 type:complete len:167 (-) Transcript_41185:223-723(-)
MTSPRHSLAFHPFVDEPRNNYDVSSRSIKLRAPDVDATPPLNLSLELGTFEDWLRDRARQPEVRQPEVIVCCFFLDCLPDVPLALQTIAAALRSGGLLVFAGPLDYHCWPAASPTVTHLLMLCDELGLDVAGPPEMLSAPYASRPHPTIAHEHLWRVPFFVCRKRF